jgi:rubredoxin
MEPQNTPKLQKYECSECFYEYNPETGDSEFNLPAGVAFEDLPDDWVCPLCGAPKSAFVPVKE